VKIDIRRNRRYYVIFSSSEILWARYEYKIINAYDLSSPLKLITIDQDIRYVDDGCQYDYHQNGKLKSAGAYVLGNRESDWKYYDEAGQLLKTEKYKNNVLLSTVPNQ
jgi:antitoxin component YwqK of YwqJK toxin-antitoxin module